MRTTRFGLFSAIPFAIAMAVSPAGAQDAQPAPAAPVAQPTSPAAQPAAPAAERGGIEEIIVTSRKREEISQDVPLAITAISKELDIASVRDLRDLNGFAPNVRIDEDPGRANGSAITIRGISPTRTDDNSFDSPIAVMIDGIYLGTTSGQVLENFDLDRVEILRGPQGTLFGKNTIGGVLNVIRSRPTGEFGARLKYTGGSFDQQEFRAVLNVPIISEKLAAKGFYTKLSSDGYIENTFTHSRMAKKDYQNYGVTLLATPFDGFEALLTIEKFDDDSQGGGSLTNYNLGAGVAAPPSDPREPNFAAGFKSCSTAPGNYALGIPYGHNSGALPLAVDPSQTIYNSGVPCRTSLKRPNTVSTDTTNPSSFNVQAYTLDMHYDLNENLRAVSLFGYRKMTEDRLLDFDGSEADYITIDRDNDYDQLSEEIRLEGSWERIKAVVGVYYWNSEFTQDWVTGGTFWTNVLAQGGIDLVNNQWLNGAPLPPPVLLCQLGAFGALACDQGINGVSPAGLGPKFTQVLFETQETKSVAVFASADWEFVEDWTLTLGIRWTTEEKDFKAGQSYLTSVARSNLRNFPAYANLDNTWDDISPHAVLAWNAMDDVLFYVSYSEGFHSGGFFGVNQNVADFVRDQYDPEFAKSGEIGAKTQLFDNRVQLNAAYFYNSFKDKQESSVQFDPSTATVATVFSNVADAVYQGIDIEAQWAPIDSLTTFFSFGWLDAQYGTFKTDLNPNDGVTIIEDASFLRPRNAPRYTVGIGGTFTYPLGPGEAQASTKYSWVDEIEGSLINLDFGRIKPRQDLLISAGYTYKNLQVTFFARNLLNEQSEVAFPIADLFAAGTLFPQPRSYGVEISMEFGE